MRAYRGQVIAWLVVEVLSLPVVWLVLRVTGTAPTWGNVAFYTLLSDAVLLAFWLLKRWSNQEET